MPDSAVTSRNSSRPAWKILVAIVVFITMIAAFFYWVTRLNETEQMLVGDWVIVSEEDGLFVEKDTTFCFRFSPDGEFYVFHLEAGETTPGDFFGSWSVNRMTIDVEQGEWEILELLRNGSGQLQHFEMPIEKLTETELILEYEGVFKRLEK